VRQELGDQPAVGAKGIEFAGQQGRVLVQGVEQPGTQPLGALFGDAEP